MYLHRVVFFVTYELQALKLFEMESAGYFDLPQIWYVGPPRYADSENVPLWGGIFRPLRVTSLVTFVKESAGYFDMPQIWYVGPPRCADSENLPM